MNPLRLPRIIAAGFLATAAIAASALAQPTFTEEQVDQAIERGVQHLLTAQQANGGWGDYKSGNELFTHGYDVCGLMGLAYGELSVSDDRLQKALKLVLEAEIDRNYVYAVRAIALSRLYPRLRREQREAVMKRLEKDVEWLINAQSKERGCWNYEGTGSIWGESSNTQMALLGLCEASNVVREFPMDVWKRALDFYLKTQRPDDGWNYAHPSSIETMESYGSMTAAGVASLFIIRDMLYRGSGCPCKSGRSPREGLEVDKAIERGIGWLKTNFVIDKNPGRGAWYMYWPFSCERVGLASGIKYFGPHDWYREMTAHILSKQGADGGWGHISDTALAIAFLAKGRAPILANKLQFNGSWNMHPRDLANLCKYVGNVKEQTIQWQVINLEIPVHEMHDAPILYISAESAMEITDDEKAKLRQFTDSGGTILFEASCANREAINWWTLVCGELWPEWELKVVEREHPLWEADQPIKGRQPALMGLNDGIRTFMFFSKVDISCSWNTEAITRNKVLFDLGSNLYMYATDKAKLRSRLAARTSAKYASQTPAKGGKDTVTVARMKHGGDWYLGRNYVPWQTLAAELKERPGLTLNEREPVAAGDDLAGVDLLYLCGRKGCDLGSGGAWLKQYLSGGGFLFAEAVLGDALGDAAIRTALQGAGLTLKALPIDAGLISGQLGQATGYNASKVEFSFHLRGERIGKGSPDLLGIYDGDKMVGVYSPFDIMYSQTGAKAFGNRGYEAADARALAANVVLLRSQL
ncbi:MAG: DUF4159 domain-containing protein [Planctomycetes bacterium]|nr:DUF4159 domain-containing protein [Planctomycetota bacterium]